MSQVSNERSIVLPAPTLARVGIRTESDLKLPDSGDGDPVITTECVHVSVAVTPTQTTNASMFRSPSGEVPTVTGALLMLETALIQAIANVRHQRLIAERVIECCADGDEGRDAR